MDVLTLRERDIAERAWCGSFLEGEGCIYLNGSDSLQVHVTQKDVRVLRRLQRRYGGGIGPHSGGAQWNASGDHAICLLEDTLPYLEQKYMQAILALRSYKLLPRNRGVRVSPAVRGLRRKYSQKVSSLKQTDIVGFDAEA